MWFSQSQDIANLGGSSLVMSIHNGSLSQLLSVVYPEYEWLPWKFTKAPKFWEDVKNQRKFMDWAGKELKIKEINDWNKVSNQVFFCFLQRFIFFQGSHESGRNFPVTFA